MVAVAVACLPVFLAGRRIGRAKGLLFVGYYAAYLAYLVLDARGHDAIDEYSSIMLGFVVPITIVTLVAMLIKDHEARSRDAAGR
jgi:cation:H+ antiporter